MKYILLLLLSLFVQISYATTVKNLDSKAILREFYGDKDMFALYLDDETEESHYLKGSSYVGVKENDQYFVVIYRGMYPYENHLGERRYLVALEKKALLEDEENYRIADCHACGAMAELMIFKENSSNNYQLLTKAQDENGSWGTSSLFKEYYDEADDPAATSQGLVLQVAMQKLENFGHDKMGSFYTDSYTGQGLTTGALYALLLNDNKIQIVYVTNHQGDNAGAYGEDSPLYYAYQSTWSVDDSQPALSYYPIKVHFTGEDYNENLKKPRITAKNQIETYVYDEKSKEYKKKYTEKLKN